jgi:hypothetical protein
LSSHEGWILALNLRPGLEMLARVGENELDEAALNACVGTLPATAEADGQWYAHTLGRLQVQLVRAAEGDRVTLKVEAPHGDRRAVEAVTMACNTSVLQDIACDRADAEATRP